MSSRFIPQSSMYQNAFLFKLAASGVFKTPQVILMICHQGWDPLSFIQLFSYLRLPGWCSGKESTANARNSRNSRDKGSMPGSGRSPGVGHGNPLQYLFFLHSSIFAWKIPRTEEPAGCSLWGCQESDTAEHTHTFLCRWENGGSERGRDLHLSSHSAHTYAHLPFPE